MTGLRPDAFDLIQVRFPLPRVDTPRPAARYCRGCVDEREALPDLPLIIRRRLNPYCDLWGLHGDGFVVADRMRAILNMSCMDQVQFWSVADLHAPHEAFGFCYVVRPRSLLLIPEGTVEVVAEHPCAGCGEPLRVYAGLPDPLARDAWDGDDLVASPLIAGPDGPERLYYVSRRLLMLLERASVRGLERFGPQLQLTGETLPASAELQAWADRTWSSLPTERTFRPLRPDEPWLEAYLVGLAERPDAVPVHPKALMAWQHSRGIALPPSFRSFLRTSDGIRIPWGPDGDAHVEVADLAWLGTPQLRVGEWDVPSSDNAQRVWDGLCFARADDGRLWAFDLVRPSHQGEYPVFEYDPKLSRPVAFFDNFVEWLQSARAD